MKLNISELNSIDQLFAVPRVGLLVLKQITELQLYTIGYISNIYIQGVPKKSGTLRKDLIFLHDLDECLEDPKKNFSFLPLSSADFCQKMAKKSLIFLTIFLPKNSISGAKNSLKCESSLFKPLFI